MIPTPIPDDEVWSGATRRVIGPPGGDLDSNVRPVEVLTEHVEGAPVYRIRCVIEEEEARRIEAGERVFWVSWWGDHLHPFAVGMAEEIVDLPVCARCGGAIIQTSTRRWHHVQVGGHYGATQPCFNPTPTRGPKPE